MPDSTQPLPHRYQPHFCRECGVSIPEKNLDGTTPHAQVWQHRIREHEGSMNEYVSCSRNCTDRAQSEEQKAGHRIYGAYVPLSAPPHGRRYDDLFPDSEDHT